MESILLREFDELAPEYGKWRIDRNIAKQFLSSSIQKVVAEERERCLKCVPDFKDTSESQTLDIWHSDTGFNSCRKQVIEAINNLK